MGLELDLLAYCCGLARNIPTLKTCGEFKELAGLDEDYFVDLAKQHKVAGAAYAGLRKAGFALSQEGTRNLAREALVGHAVRSLLLRDWLEIVAAFKAEDIRILTIKGPASSIQLYGDPLIREFYDLDILADFLDIQQVLPLMARLGYEPTDTLALSPTAKTGHFVQKQAHHVNFQKAGRPFHIEIHGKAWQEDKAFPPEFVETLLGRAVPLGESEGWGDTLDLADHILFIIAHGTQHEWCLLHWLLDLAVILHRHDNALHQALADQIRASAMERQLKLACAIVRSLYPVTIPEPLQTIIDDEPVSLTLPLRFAQARIQTGGKDQATFRNMILRFTIFLPVLTKEPVRRARIIFSPFLTPQKDIETLPLPKFLYFLYVPLRPFFVVSRMWKRRFGRGAVHVA